MVKTWSTYLHFSNFLFSLQLVLSGYKKLATYSHQKKSSTSINPPNDIAPNRQSLGYIHAVVMSMYPATGELVSCCVYPAPFSG